MEPPEAPSSSDPSQHTAAEPPPEEPVLQLPSEAQPTITPTPSSSAVSVSLSSSSPSSAVSPSQPQSQSSLHQRQPVAARTRSHTQLGQSQFTPSTSSSSSSASSIQRNGPSIGLPAGLPHHARPPSSAGYSYGYPSHFSQPFASSSSPSQSLSQPFGGFPRSSLPTAEQSSGSNAPSASFSQPFSAMPRSSAGVPDQQPNSNSQFKPPVPGVQTIGMIGSLSGAPRMKASGIQHQQRLGQPIDKSLPQSATNQTSNAQIDPYEKLEPEVEDVLMEIADEFVDSITTAACSLAKHRRSTALEAKDIVLYVERNWNMTLPGFGGDDIKLYKKPHTTDIHKERLAMIKKSMGMANDMVSTKNVAAGQVAANSKSQAGKSSVPTFTSPKVT